MSRRCFLPGQTVRCPNCGHPIGRAGVRTIVCVELEADTTTVPHVVVFCLRRDCHARIVLEPKPLPQPKRAA